MRKYYNLSAVHNMQPPFSKHKLISRKLSSEAAMEFIASNISSSEGKIPKVKLNHNSVQPK